ncbi:MAG TPA: RuBisCO large subunit C-terminal-like domain-containing protein [Anaerolineae bacterium]|nr:RuBisCO large subunit C-terminal-like domain-containing protein [Anaerolineae bacterium]
MIFPHTHLSLSGERLTVTYSLGAADLATARQRAEGICLEQTVELPAGLLAQDDLGTQVVGRLEALTPRPNRRFEAVISYASETVGDELTQLLNVVFGNTSMQPAIRVEQLSLPPSLLALFKGARFGQAGLRRLLGVERRPLLCTALKPLGLSAPDLAALARQFALGGIDLIKDDHGLANQSFAPFKDRVQRCAAAVAETHQQTGQLSLYAPNITAGPSRLLDNAWFAKEAGAGAVMITPGLTGLEAIRQLAMDDRFGLPILSHPAFRGTLVIDPEQGMSHGLVYGLLPRLAGADASIYVNFGGRFAFSQADCRAIVEATTAPLGPLPPIFPMPGGGMTLAHLPEMLTFYGREVILLIAGGLYGHGPNLLDNCRQFRAQAEALS